MPTTVLHLSQDENEYGKSGTRIERSGRSWTYVDEYGAEPILYRIERNGFVHFDTDSGEVARVKASKINSVFGSGAAKKPPGKTEAKAKAKAKSRPKKKAAKKKAKKATKKAAKRRSLRDQARCLRDCLRSHT